MKPEGELVESVPVEARDGFEMVVSDPRVMEEVCERVAGGERLVDVARAWGVRARRLLGWIEGDEGRRAEYELALRVRAGELVGEALAISDGADLEVEGRIDRTIVQRDQLRVNTRLKLAAAMDRERWGEGRKDGRGGGGLKVVVVDRSADGEVSVTQVESR